MCLSVVLVVLAGVVNSVERLKMSIVFIMYVFVSCVGFEVVALVSVVLLVICC